MSTTSKLTGEASTRSCKLEIDFAVSTQEFFATIWGFTRREDENFSSASLFCGFARRDENGRGAEGDENGGTRVSYFPFPFCPFFSNFPFWLTVASAAVRSLLFHVSNNFKSLLLLWTIIDTILCTARVIVLELCILINIFLHQPLKFVQNLRYRFN